MTTESTNKTLLVCGARGVVGQHLVARATDAGWKVRVLTRSAPDARADINVFHWDPPRAAQGEDTDQVVAALEGTDLVVNLAGASLAEGRLGDEHKRRVLQSRLDATAAVAEGLQRCKQPPPVWINASATGFYGDRGEQDLDETSSRGGGYLAAVCERWEQAATSAKRPEQTRLILARLGLVLADDAMAWKQMLLPIKLGVGGPLGSGQQWWSWIDADDAARAFLFLAGEPTAEGVYNLTTADPVRQGDLAREIATIVRRPAMFPAPAFLLRLATGGVADELLLPSCRAFPTRLAELGFKWSSPLIGRELLELLEA